MNDAATKSLPIGHPLVHPLAGKSMTGAEMIVQVLADEGVEAIFGYSGGAILPTYDAIFTFNEQQKACGARQLPLIVPANEQGAGFMAAGYARSSGKVGVCLVTSGPGATNTVTPVRDCMADSVPIVVICGQVARRRHRHRCLPGGAGGVADGRRSPSTCSWSPIRRAWKPPCVPRSRSRAPGGPDPVVIDIPKDVQNTTGVFRGEGRWPFRATVRGCAS